jgi:integrase
VTTLRAAFAWLVDIRYLAGNPWRASRDPAVTAREADIRVDRALSSSLWRRLRAFVDEQCALTDGAYWRTVRAVLLLSGESGLRREELCHADRAGMSETAFGSPDARIWQLNFVGKGNKERTVPVSPAAIDALRAHWLDHGLSFDLASTGHLVKPLFIPKTPQAEKKYAGGLEACYSPNSINDMMRWVRKRAIAGIADLSPAEAKHLATTSTHAFRHTFGTQAAAEDVPVDVIQKMLGHKSLQTTSLYIQAEKRRMLSAVASYYDK